MKRIVIFIGVATVAFLGPWWALIPAAAGYAFWRPAYELVVLGVLVDAFVYSPDVFIPFRYTLALAGLVLAVEYCKPYLSYYKT